MTEEALEACAQAGGPLRPTFCNIPGWAEVVIYLVGFLSLAVFAYGVVRHWRVWMGGQPDAPARHAVRRRERVGYLLTHVLGQRATLARRFPGLFHTGIFWGFLVLFLGTVLATIDWDITRLLLDLRILKGGFYVAYEAVLDTFGFLFVVGLLLAIWRRYILQPPHVAGAWDFVLWMLLVVSVTGFLVEGLRLAMSPVDWGGYSWVGQGIANLVQAAPESFLRGTVPALHLWLWLLHAGASFLFIAAIPFTNAVHLAATSANVVLRSTEPVPTGAALLPVELENAEFFGVSRLGELTWKQRLGVDSCLRCGRCETVCPAFLSGTPLNPKSVIVTLSEKLREELDAPPWVGNGHGNGGAAEQLLVGEDRLIEPGALWACTTCLACVQACPGLIEIVDDVVDLRRYLALSEGALPATAAQTLRRMGTAGNPWGYPPEERLAWAAGLGVPVAEADRHYEVLYWVGCSAAYDPRNQKIARATARLLQAAGVSFAVMAEERCHCESARRLGEEYLYQTAAEENIANLARYRFDRILCHCPHCFNTLHNEYPRFGGRYDVVHHSQLFRELLAAGRLKTGRTSGRRLAFHDSCYLGRYNGEYEAPRAALRAAGVVVVDPPRRREDGLCCGGGGGKMWFDDEQYEKKVELHRVEEVLATGPDAVAVACPFCLTMLDSAARTLGSDVAVLDVAEVLARSLDESAGSVPAAKEEG